MGLALFFIIITVLNGNVGCIKPHIYNNKQSVLLNSTIQTISGTWGMCCAFDLWFGGEAKSDCPKCYCDQEFGAVLIAVRELEPPRKPNNSCLRSNWLPAMWIAFSIIEEKQYLQVIVLSPRTFCCSSEWKISITMGTGQCRWGHSNLCIKGGGEPLYMQDTLHKHLLKSMKYLQRTMGRKLYN